MFNEHGEFMTIETGLPTGVPAPIVTVMWIRVVLLALVVAGCRSGNWHIAPVAPDQMIGATHPKRVRLTLNDSSVLVLKNPEVSGDSIAGKSSGAWIAVPAASIVRADVPKGVEADEPPFSSWRTEKRPPHEVITKKRPGRVRLTLADSSRLELQHPVSVGDSIIGFVADTRTAIPSADIVRTEIRKTNDWKLFGFMTLAASAYALVYFALCNDAPDCPKEP